MRVTTIKQWLGRNSLCLKKDLQKLSGLTFKQRPEGREESRRTTKQSYIIFETRYGRVYYFTRNEALVMYQQDGDFVRDWNWKNKKPNNAKVHKPKRRKNCWS